MREGDGDADLQPVGAIRRSTRFVGARQGDADAGFADRDLLRSRAVNDPLVDRNGRGQARRTNVDFHAQRLAVELDQNLAGFNMRAVHDVDRAHDATLSAHKFEEMTEPRT